MTYLKKNHRLEFIKILRHKRVLGSIHKLIAVRIWTAVRQLSTFAIVYFKLDHLFSPPLKHYHHTLFCIHLELPSFTYTIELVYHSLQIPLSVCQQHSVTRKEPCYNNLGMLQAEATMRECKRRKLAVDMPNRFAGEHNMMNSSFSEK